MRLKRLLMSLGLTIYFLGVNAQGWNADVGNGKYKNPILHVDYSDPDVCAGKEGYYMTASSFNSSPGLPILHSNDLVNWELIGYALQNQAPVEHFRTVRHGDGVWAPSIRYHNGEYYIYWGNPDFGIYMVKTKDPAGIWEEPVLVKEGKGYIDTCPFWDKDGKAYLSYAFAGSRASVKTILMLSEMNSDGTELIGNPAMVFDGHNGHTTVEGSKMYYLKGYYWIMAPAGGVKTGWQLAMRSKNIWGPYESKVVLQQGDTAINGPHQGGYVETPNGDGWFIHFQDRWAFGRIVHLEPVNWKEDWPIIGLDTNHDGIGEPVSEWKKPNVGKSYPATPLVSSDEFNNHQYGLQWQWQANQNPNEQWGWQSANLGYLRLNCIPRPEEMKTMWMMPNLFLQKFPGANFTATTKLTFENNPDAKECSTGLIVFGEDYSYIAIEQSESGDLKLVQRLMKEARTSKESEVEIASIGIDQKTVYFRAKVEMIQNVEPYDAKVTFYYSTNGKVFKEFGTPFKPSAGRWVGAKIGMFATGTTSISDSSYADYDWFRVNEN
ncbi:glycoside hydrolase family 43 protein [Flavobacterium cellulosilyticum]|uniref:Glycosyl hydrolase 43 family protein n=1 Tax=Flavobacterium cellulosilyticum TaxID=2541731 RepID=A0A4R5CF86_9FLAO|nr:glycoside hydrolase 43 family protein [Flavobacterium cellulosilyticum]TDD98741.1 glycosyl hydrolase 43 family protein [Flavobacterium cellulosilyticum]